eukprot:747184-Hanusia_phi.AAC.3
MVLAPRCRRSEAALRRRSQRLTVGQRPGTHDLAAPWASELRTRHDRWQIRAPRRLRVLAPARQATPSRVSSTWQ